jgi:hypothetical protein
MRGGENGEKQNGDEGGDDDEIHLEHTGEQKVGIIITSTYLMFNLLPNVILYAKALKCMI